MLAEDLSRLRRLGGSNRDRCIQYERLNTRRKSSLIDQFGVGDVMRTDRCWSRHCVFIPSKCTIVIESDDLQLGGIDLAHGKLSGWAAGPKAMLHKDFGVRDNLCTN